MEDSVADVKLVAILSVILENKKLSSSHFSLLVKTPTKVCSFIALSTGLSKLRVKDAMVKGAVWLKRNGQKEKRIRKATFNLLPGDRINFYYDPNILSLIPLSPRLIAEEKHYSVWFKPANLLTQGTRFGDHCSLLRLIELYYKHKKEIFIVHRLDREAYGLVVVAHSRISAAALSELFRTGRVEKRYLAKVNGRFNPSKKNFRLSRPLDGKNAVTIITDISFSSADETSTLDILLQTGRYHQIRRHLSMEGYPIMGDPRYGNAPYSPQTSLQLCAYELQFVCPFSQKARSFKLEDTNKPG
jgi:tRNA pseudouridine32 synthase/23S rRNA pseudouridine746 synthase